MPAAAAALALGLAAAALAACADPAPRLRWGVGVATFDAVALGIGVDHPPAGLAARVAPTLRLDLPTYDGSGQVVHPDILVEDTRLVMAMTPYPFSNDDFENPSILTSADGAVFEEVAGASPIVGPPPFDHNDDPDLRVDPRTGEYEVLYLETLRPDRQNLVALRSRDLVTWTRRDAIRYDLLAGDPFIVSPAAIEVGGTTHLFVVDLGRGGGPGVVKELTSADGQTWDLAAAAPIALDAGDLLLWHVDVFRAERGYAMLISAFRESFERQSLYLATSPDLVTWKLRPEPLLDAEDPALELESLYRSTGVVSGDTLVVWYSHEYRPR